MKEIEQYPQYVDGRILITVDTKEKKNDHILAYFNRVNQHFLRFQCNVGDYEDYHSRRVAVDTKRDLVELANDVCSKDGHRKMHDKIDRAKKVGTKLIFLIEEDMTLEDVKHWVSPTNKSGKPLTAVKGETLYKVMKTMAEKYDVQWRFCSPDVTGPTIVAYLKGTLE